MNDASMLFDALRRRLVSVEPEVAWGVLLDAGVLGMLVPEALGGLALNAHDAIPVIEALGERALATPFLETAVIAPVLLSAGRSPMGDECLRAVAHGATLAIAGLDPRLRANVSATPTGAGWRLDGDALLVLDGADADHLLVAARTETYATALLLVERDQAGVLPRPYPTIDGRKAADLRFIAAEAILLSDDAEEVLNEAGDVALACLAIEAAALMRRLVADTVDYAKGREQFGQPIARFQVVQHRLVDMHVQVRRARAIAYRAMAALDGNWAERARLASAAKVTIGEAGRFVGQNAVQLHGGMGMSEELEVGRCFKRLTTIEHELGNADQHRQRYARMAAQLAA